MNKDLTVGKPGKVLLLYTLPLLGSIIFQQLYNVADSFVAGHFINSNALAAVGNSYEITLLYIAVAFGCNMGVSVIVARYFGVKNYQKVKSAALTSIITCCVIAIVLSAIGLLLSRNLLKLIQTKDEIMDDSALYLNIYLSGYIFVLIYNVSTGIFAALGDSLTPFIFLAISSVSNVGMDILFVTQFKMGVAGVAWATFICQGVSGIAAFAVVLKKLHALKTEEKLKIFDFLLLKQMTKIAVPSALQQGFISVGNLIIQGFINSAGVSATAGYSATIKLHNLTITSFTALGNGMSNFTSQNIGADKPERVKGGFKAGAIMAACLGVVFTIIYLTLGRTFLGWFITDGNEEAISIGVKFLQIVTPFYVIVAIKLIADGVLRGSDKMIRFMVATFTDLALRVIFSAVFSNVLGVNGIWYAWPIGWCIATVLSLVFYFNTSRKNFVK